MPTAKKEVGVTLATTGKHHRRGPFAQRKKELVKKWNGRRTRRGPRRDGQGFAVHRSQKKKDRTEEKDNRNRLRRKEAPVNDKRKFIGTVHHKTDEGKKRVGKPMGKKENEQQTCKSEKKERALILGFMQKLQNGTRKEFL